MAETVKIEGLAKLNRELKKVATELPKELKAVSKDAAEIVASEARVIVPQRSGKLASTIKPGATTKGAYVKAGASLPYAKPIHFGWPKHNIEPNPFLYDALDGRRDDVIAAFRTGLDALIEKNFTPGLN